MVLEIISKIIGQQLTVEQNEITMASDFKEDLGIDSLRIFEIIMELEEKFKIEIPTEDLEGIDKVADLVHYLDERISQFQHKDIAYS